MKIKNTKYIHFIGIGGIGTSSIAQILKKKGKIISGSDAVSSDITKTLKLAGIKIKIGHSDKNISKKHQLIIYSPAIPSKNPELKKAKKLKIRTISYPEALGELSEDYFTIAVAGTHGKSTTTAITALVAEKGNLDPTVVIGTKIKQFNNKNFRVGESKYFILEACEYRKSFLKIKPDILIITNIEAEHLDYYKNLQNYKKAFELLAKKVNKSGKIIINSDDKDSNVVVKSAKGKVITWSKSDKNSDFLLKKNVLKKLNKKSEQKSNNKIQLNLKIPGKFNLNNAVFSTITGVLLGIENK
ncbi:UDP-N-acetylmuramate--L-alanine ligase, partial [Candidatus Peregrinibacteria bacterium]|nr:UDP-N-acetylmuramate--L-alanine ligase [Candidatus Peregrinibacteria bacterium]